METILVIIFWFLAGIFCLGLLFGAIRFLFANAWMVVFWIVVWVAITYNATQ